MIFYTKSYTHWPKGTPLVEQPNAWWGTYQAGVGAIVDMVVAEDPLPNGIHGHPAQVLARQIPLSRVLEGGLLQPLTPEEIEAWHATRAT